jgi:hypothetical protein
VWPMSSGDYFTVKALQNAGGTKGITGSSHFSHNAWAQWLGPTS